MVAFAPGRSDVPPGSVLIAAQLAELAQRPGWVQSSRSPSATPAELAPPDGTFLIGWQDGVAIACGGVKYLDDGVGELKRLYVAPSARSQGVSIDLMAALEDAARELGYRRVLMDTSHPKSAAISVSLGYVEVPDYNGNPNAIFWAEKNLAT